MCSGNNANIIIMRQHKCLIDKLWLGEAFHSMIILYLHMKDLFFTLAYTAGSVVTLSDGSSSFSCLLYTNVSHLPPLSLMIFYFLGWANYISNNLTHVYILVSFAYWYFLPVFGLFLLNVENPFSRLQKLLICSQLCLVKQAFSFFL